MDVLEAIKSRRSIRKYEARPLEREKIEQVLEAATWAPHHNDTEPWHFYVVTGAAKAQLAEIVYDLMLNGGLCPPEDDPQEMSQRNRERVQTAGAVIAVTADPGIGETMRQENYAAVSAAIQNLMLAAHGLGLGTLWRTGGFEQHAAVRSLVGVPETATVVGLILIGYPEIRPKKERIPAAAKTTWVESAG